MPSSYTLGKHYEAFIQGQLTSGRYNNASEVVREVLRLVEDYELVLRSRADELRSMVDEGRASGLSSEEGPDVLGRLKAKYQKMAASPGA